MSPTATTTPPRTPSRTRRPAPAPARPRHQPAPSGPRRHLRSVPQVPTPTPESTGRRRRRLRPQAALMMAILAFFVILFAVALLQTVLVQGQLHLDGLRADLGERQAEAQLLRDEVATLESPANLVARAREQGFVEVDPTYVRGVTPTGAATP